MSVTFIIRGKRIPMEDLPETEGKFEIPDVSSCHPSAISESNPWTSVGCGCHPRQVKKMNAALKEHGAVGARYHPDGSSSADSRGARRELLKCAGLHDNEGGYGDG